MLRGVGANITCPVGTMNADVEVHGIKKVVEVCVVENCVVGQPALLGHPFAEVPDIVITGTPSELIFNKINSDKVFLTCCRVVCIQGVHWAWCMLGLIRFLVVMFRWVAQ